MPWLAAARAHRPRVMAAAAASHGIQSYYSSKIDELEVVVREKTSNLRRLEAQRNELNSKVRQRSEGGRGVGWVLSVALAQRGGGEGRRREAGGGLRRRGMNSTPR
mmetsp:Transcript_26628/g.80730  ORF Transcript_26628/g.80730 Transcript_26628/m.80730 type:complete len:106 (+) Transcript_26628:3-320(+)